MKQPSESKKKVKSRFAIKNQDAIQKAIWFQNNGHAAAAEEIYLRLLKASPKEPVLLTNLGIMAIQRGDSQAGLQWIDSSLAIFKNQPVAWSSKGVGLLQMDHKDQALECLERAIKLDTRNAGAYINRGRVFSALNRTSDALQDYEKSIQINGKIPQAHFNRGNALRDLRRFDEASESYDDAIHLNENYAMAHVAKALMNLLIGNFDAGWKGYEWRWKVPSMRRSRFDTPHWTGKISPKGKVLVIYPEQGLGDVIQFCRYAPVAKKLDADVIIESPPELFDMMQSLGDGLTIRKTSDPLTGYDLHCPVLSLPLAFQTDLDNIPSAAYLKAPSSKVDFWAKRLGQEYPKFRVGLVWSGGHRPGVFEHLFVNQRRNIPLLSLEGLKNEDIEFYSLQKGSAPEKEWADMRLQGWNGPEIIDFTSDIHDFSDTAGLIENLDLVITVDTSVAHLAGAMGKKVWILNRYDTCWRWLLDRSDSPWYPSATVFRQSAMGDWSNVIDEVAVELRLLVKDRRC